MQERLDRFFGRYVDSAGDFAKSLFKKLGENAKAQTDMVQRLVLFQHVMNASCLQKPFKRQG